MQRKPKPKASAFEKLTRAIVSVPKHEVDRKAEEYERAKTKRGKNRRKRA